MPPALLTKVEVAALMKVSTRTVNRWLAAGSLKAIRKGNVLRFRAEDIDKFIQKNTR